jgi:hypothetical protein
MKQHVWAVMLAAAGLSAAGPAGALEGYGNYDSFTGTGPLAAEKWRSFERVREVRNGELVMQQREWGGIDGDSGTTGLSYSSNFADPERVKQLKAQIRVDAWELTDCAANPAVGSVRARLQGSFFNTGNRVAGSSLGDVFAQVGIRRDADSTAATTSLKTYGSVDLCTATDCSTTLSIGFVELGAATVGAPLTMIVEWDKPNKRFRFSKDDGATFKVVNYTVYDGDQPGSLLRAAGTRITTENCLSGPRTTGRIEAAFDNVSVNLNAKP